MAGGIEGFAEGFSGGLNQGLGIMRSFRDEKRQGERDALQKKQIEHSMELQDKGEARAQTQFEGQQEDRTWNNTNVRPLNLDHLKLSVDRTKQLIEQGKTEQAMKELQLEWMPGDHALEVQLKKNQDARAGRAEARADRAQTFGEFMQRAHLGIAQQQAADSHTEAGMRQAAALLPIYTSLREQGLPAPPAMEKIIQNSPFSISNLVEQAQASAQFPQILGMAAKGDFSFMNNPTMAESAFSLSRPVGMRIARQKGYDATSARVTDMEIAKGGGVWMTVSAYDPKSGTYKTFKHGVNADGLAGQMQLAARSGQALLNHPAYQNLANNEAGYLRAFKGDIRAAAAAEWDKVAEHQRKLVEADPSGKDAQTAAAKQWLARYPDPQSYANAIQSGSMRAQSARGRDVSRYDSNRVYSTAAKYTGIMDFDGAMTRANGAIRIIGQLKGVPLTNIPGITKLARELGANDPAEQVRLFYEIQKSPELRKELASAIRGGSGAGNPSGGGRTPNAKPIGNAKSVAEQLYPGIHVTDWQRDPNSALGRANPGSWHNHTGAAIDARPMKGMSFQEYVNGFRAKGYKIIEAIDEVANPSKHATGKHWHVVLGV